MDYLNNKYGLVTDNDTTSENGQLFLAELTIIAGTQHPKSWFHRMIMNEQLVKSYAGKKGLYHRNPDLTDKRIMSHDNLSGIMSWSHIWGSFHRKDIWSYLLKHLGTYDNSQGKSKQLSRFLPFNLSNFFIWGLCAESNIYLLFFPFYLVNLLITCNKKLEDTSGKILSMVELYPHKDHWLCRHLFNYYEKKMIKQYGQDYVRELMKIYHGKNSKKFPINDILGIGV